MREDEIREAGALVGAALGEASRGVHRIHGAIAGRVRRALGRAAGVSLGAGSPGVPGPPATGPITSLTYAAVDLGLVTAGRVGGLVLARTHADDRAAADSAGRLLAMVNGSHGHLLHARKSPLALTASVRAAGGDVPLTPAAVRTTWPQAGGELAVYVHGLVDCELRWGQVGGDGLDASTLPDRLARDLGLTPVLVRYNTGRRIEDSARAVSELLGALVRAWPVPVTRIVLIGHSMGGLVGRQAVAQATEAGSAEADWAGLVTDVITIGTPHGGGWLEHAVDRLSPHLARLPETAWIGEQIEQRSDGIRDLGAPRAATLPTSIRERAVVGALVGAVIGVVPGEIAAPIGRAVGDLMVGVDSASGGLSPDSVAVITGATHLALTHDPRVGEQLVRWLTPATGPLD